MKASAQDFAHVCVLTLSGEFTSDDGHTFRRALGDRLESGRVKHIVVDCEHLDFIDSVGLETVLDLQDSLVSSGGALRLAHPDETLRTILRMTRLDAALESSATVEDAVRSMR